MKMKKRNKGKSCSQALRIKKARLSDTIYQIFD